MPDPRRVKAHLFLPGEEADSSRSRAADVVARVMAMPSLEVRTALAEVLERCSGRYADPVAVFEEHAAIMGSHVVAPRAIDRARRLLLGATFTSESAVEGAGLCNPSAVEHPDQTGLPQGHVRVALAVRGIGEGHVSSIGFAEAVIGPAATWHFVSRAMPVEGAVRTPGRWSLREFREAVAHAGVDDELSHSVMEMLPESVTAADVELALDRLPNALTGRSTSAAHRALLRDVASSAYEVAFGESSTLSQRVLTPASGDESRGMEDARFVLFTDRDGRRSYRASYNGYDGRVGSSRMLVSPDLRAFQARRLSGDAVRDKGLALFPRPVHGECLALSRTGRDTLSLARSERGFDWSTVGELHRPREYWEAVQAGTCGPPLETPHGWVVVFHGVGPLRTYSLGAMLLDLDDPLRVIGVTRRPLLGPAGDRRDGYVPHVVYSCGGIVVADTVWIPFGIGDSRIGVYSIEMDELISLMFG